jgi:hypothetical protein
LATKKPQQNQRFKEIEPTARVRGHLPNRCHVATM